MVAPVRKNIPVHGTPIGMAAGARSPHFPSLPRRALCGKLEVRHRTRAGGGDRPCTPNPPKSALLNLSSSRQAACLTCSPCRADPRAFSTAIRGVACHPLLPHPRHPLVSARPAYFTTDPSSYRALTHSLLQVPKATLIEVVQNFDLLDLSIVDHRTFSVRRLLGLSAVALPPCSPRPAPVSSR